MKSFEKEIMNRMQQERIQEPNPEFMWTRIQQKRNTQEGTKKKMGTIRLTVTIASAFLMIAAIGGGYGNEIVHAASSLFKQVFGSIEEVKRIDPHADEQVAEKDLEIAKKVLTNNEFEQYMALLKEQKNIMQNAMEVENGEQKIYMDRLTNEQKSRLDENEKSLRPLLNKIRKNFVYTADEAAKLLPFPVKHPDYVPKGYKLMKEEARAEETTGTPQPMVTLTYQQSDGEFGFIIRQSAILAEEDDEYSRRIGSWDHEESYILKGNQVKYAQEGKNVTMMKWIVPAKGERPSYQVFIIADLLTKEEMENIAVSMIDFSGSPKGS